MNGMSICIGCGCTDQHACEGGCSWVVRDAAAGVGVCSNCSHALPRWDDGARAAAFLSMTALRQGVTVNLGGQLEPYRPGTNQPRGKYFVVDFGRGTLRVVDEQGQPAIAPRAALSIEPASSGKYLRPWRMPDEIRADQLKLERRRTRNKAAKRSRQAARRRG